MLESLLVPTGIVALAEIGDKTQLLALILAARFRKPWPIIAGIVAATLANHAAAGAVGAWISSYLTDSILHWILAASFTATSRISFSSRHSHTVPIPPWPMALTTR